MMPRLLRAGGSAEKLRRLQAVTDAALSQLGVEDLLQELLERTRELLSADTAAIMLLDRGGDLIATAASGLEAEVRLGVRVPVGQGFAGTVAARGAPVAIEELDPAGVVSPVLAGRVVSVLGVPMLNQGEVIGVLHVGTATRRRFTADDIELLQLVADRASLATQARLSRLDRAATVALQRSLLPARPQPVPGIDVAARYLPGAEVGVGGDWYDVFALPSGYTGVAIGDVSGHGLRAAVVMGRIRSALRAYALETDDPADVLTRLDRKVQLFEPDAMATVVYAVITPDRHGVELSSAGHLPPLLTRPDRPARFAEVPPDLPLGTRPGTARRTTPIRFDDLDGLFLYTDGLVERRRHSLRQRLEVLRTTVTAAAADTVCATAMAAMLGEHATDDDVAVLVVRREDTG